MESGSQWCTRVLDSREQLDVCRREVISTLTEAAGSGRASEHAGAAYRTQAAHVL